MNGLSYINKECGEKLSIQCQMFANRLSKKYKHLRKWAKRSHISCYRLYDKDIPEIPLAIDFYAVLSQNSLPAVSEIENTDFESRYLKIYLYERPYEKSDAEEQVWLSHMICVACDLLQVPDDHVFCMIRRKQKGDSQYTKQQEKAIRVRVLEQDLIFLINLNTYLDTGLFFDHRPLRALVRQNCCGAAVLNLFCYTGAFSVYAAHGGAAIVDSVDLSNTYLSWTAENLKINGFGDTARYRCIKSDAVHFLRSAQKENKRWDYIILDPPTFSNSHNTSGILDINKDWPELVNMCISLLNPRGVLYFSTNSRKLEFNQVLIRSRRDGLIPAVKDITEQTIPEDFRGKRPHRCWQITI